jgi:tetratricopeptide (TPR) repeat protein
MPRRARKASPPSPAAQPLARRWNDAVAFALIVGTTFLAYWPALNGMRLWDDEGHLTRQDLQSLHGLWRIWFDLGATQQYYPLLHSAFWMEHRIWGDWTPGYHAVNILLHVASAWLVVLLARRLALGGAWLAGAVFALHPAGVEAVAWISEQKSTLSGLFCLAAALVYLDFDETRRRGRYFVALALFVCALLSKSVTATLPAALLVVFWWKRGRVEWKRDVIPLVPWLGVGAVAGLFTAWVERHYIHAEGADFALTVTDRALLAGRVVWLYLAHLVWPANLMFFYPRFRIDARDPLQYLWPAGALLAMAGLVRLARRRRGPLAAALLFAGTLFPALGFLNVYPFIYSWVADHFAYLAAIAVIVPLCALLTRVSRGYAVPVSTVLVTILGLLTWRQAHDYADIETLWGATIERNPAAWMPHYNLGVIYAASPGRTNEAISEYRTAILYKPDLAKAHANLATELEKQPGGFPEALREYEAALRLAPDPAEIHSDYGLALLSVPDRLPEAVAQLEAAVRLDPRLVAAHTNLAIALARVPRRLGEAVSHARRAIELDPSSVESHNTLGSLYVMEPQRNGEAIAEFQTALRLQPANRQARYNLANALAAAPGRLPEAVAEYEMLLRAWPDAAEVHYNFGLALSRQPGNREAVIREYETALRLQPDLMEAHYNLALALSFIPGRVPDAIAHLEAAQRLAPGSPEVAQMLARARAMRR